VTFEERFFGVGNRLRWDAIEAGSLSSELKERLGPFLNDLRRNPEVLVLPRVADDGRVLWYVLCASGRIARSARDELRAFLGPSYSDFEGQPRRLDPNDPVEAAVLERYGSNAFRIEIPTGVNLNSARERLRLMTRVRDERPARHARRVRATGRVLRDFEYALLTRDGEVASECIAELRSTGRLGASNALFLEVRRLAALEQWAAVLKMPELGSLLATARPRRVTQAIIGAVYADRLRQFEDQNCSADAIGLFRSDILPRYRDLYTSRAGLSGFEVDVSFMLLAAASEVPRRELADGILSGYPTSNAQRDYLAAIAKSVSSPIPPPIAEPLDEARTAFAAGDIDRAYEIATALVPSFDRTVLLLRCARETGTLEAARVSLDAFHSLVDADRDRLRANAMLTRLLGTVVTLATEQTIDINLAAPAATETLPSSWPDWFRRLNSVEAWRGAVAVADAGAREWDIDALIRNPESLAETAELLLADRPEWGKEALRNSLPHLVEFFLTRPTNNALRTVFDNLFLAIAVDDQVSRSQFAMLSRIAEARIQLGVTTPEYRDMVGQLASAMDQVGSPAVADAALDAIDMLINAPCPDSNERQNFLVRVSAMCLRWYRRIDGAQWSLLRRFGEELGVTSLGEPPPDEATTDPTDSEWTSLNGKRLALYSLRETALRRVDAILKDLCPNVHVNLFHDHVGGSPALRTAAATADVFVLATAAAKHAATQFIEANRPQTRTTLYARGQGSASLLDALREYIRVAKPED
jgi:hypothetical protein